MFLKNILKGCVFVIVECLALLFLFSGIFSLTGCKNWMLTFVNILIRLLGATLFSFAISDGKGGILKGLLAGLLSFLCAELLFMIFSGFNFSVKMIGDLIFSLIFGVISGIIFANLKNNLVNS